MGTGTSMPPMENTMPINILIPMAGAGSRFVQAGYTDPKPLIDVAGKKMIEWVVENIQLEGRYIFILQKEHLLQYPRIETTLRSLAETVELVIVDGVTEGAACTALLAKDLIDNGDPLLICNSDQWVDWDAQHFLRFVNRKDSDGALLTFFSDSPKHSYSRYNFNTQIVTEVAEKQVISNFATVGIYYWKKGSSYVRCAEQMITKNIRFNNEFYICPVYNELIFSQNGQVHLYPICEMRGMGTPEELNKFLELLEAEGV